MTELYALPQTWSVDEILEAFGISQEKLEQLMKDGKVGHYTAKRKPRFFADNLGQIRAALEVKPTDVSQDDLLLIGTSRQSAARRRRKMTG